MTTDMTDINFAISKYCSIGKEQGSLIRNFIFYEEDGNISAGSRFYRAAG